ncbi:dolichol-phosphate mannosyltransferase subunit 3-like [Acanthaster planci]|uniref:Dolichol-phosphate mannosyltransferase subunit 3 n=1 Tax=Acanthaster planci TaxID=133434 RepID=A0A8B7YRM4_ACAPL|nr:dolichol-phosphate mannosyltransferase subunit 3-like [Acanthaster planci]XP_022095929.1 dolichol-phosphate mannosyltransferase subunit 3-like [Acanthaster planci]XP_022095930.1 dolichol-phosphate mannosyltransferase subunit 3-like [Acanthaster planci]
MATKLVQWITALVLFASIWCAFVFDLVPIQVDARMKEVIVPLPVYLLIVFACFSLATIGYRVATFNDCEEAAESLKKEIEEARKDLKKKGFRFT